MAVALQRQRSRASSAPPRHPKPQLLSQPIEPWSGPPLLETLPEDGFFSFISFLGSADLIAISGVCRDFNVAARRAASARFFESFGAVPVGLPWLKLFQLVDRVADTNDAGRKDLICWAAMRGHTKFVKEALTSAPKWADCSMPGSGSTPLTLAVEHGQPAVVALLLELGADSSRADAAGLAPAHHAARLGRDALLGTLLRYDAAAGDCITPDGRTPLMFAAAAGHGAAVALLLEAESRVNASTFVRDDQGSETALHLAAHNGHAGIVAQLLATRANPNVQMRNGRTPLILACERAGPGGGRVALQLVTRSVFMPVDLSLTTDSGKTALYCACERGHAQLVALLLDAGADPSQATRRNKLPLYAAAEGGHLAIARMLLDRAGSAAATDVFVKTTYGTTAMFAASRCANAAMKALLSAYASGKPPKRLRAESRGPSAAGGGASESAASATVPKEDAGADEGGSASAAGSLTARSTSPGGGGLQPSARSPTALITRASSGGSESLVPQSVLEAAAAAATADREARQHRAQWQAKHAQRVAQLSERIDVPLFTEESIPRGSGGASTSRRSLGPVMDRGSRAALRAALETAAASTSADDELQALLADVDTTSFTVYPRGQHAPDHLLVAAAAVAAGGAGAGADGGGGADVAGAPHAPPPMAAAAAATAGNTVSEVLARQRVAREAAEAEARARAEAADELHRQRAAELAVRARQRLEEKAAAEAAAAEAEAAATRRKEEASERRRKKAAEHAAAEFARRSAERAAKERAALQQIGLMQGSSGSGSAVRRQEGAGGSTAAGGGAAPAAPAPTTAAPAPTTAAPAPTSPTASAASGNSHTSGQVGPLPRVASKAWGAGGGAAAAAAAPPRPPRETSSPEPPPAAVRQASHAPQQPPTAGGGGATGLLPPLHDRKPKRRSVSRPRHSGSASSRDPSPRREPPSSTAARHGGAAAGERPPLPTQQAPDLPYFVADAAAAIPHSQAAPTPRAAHPHPPASTGGGWSMDNDGGGSDDGSDNGLDGWDDDGGSVAPAPTAPLPKRSPPTGAVHPHSSPAMEARHQAQMSSTPSAAMAAAHSATTSGRRSRAEDAEARSIAAAVAPSPLVAALLATQLPQQSPRGVGAGAAPRRSVASADWDPRHRDPAPLPSSLALPVTDIGLGAAFASSASQSRAEGGHAERRAMGGEYGRAPEPAHAPVRRTQSYNVADVASRGQRVQVAATANTSREARVAVAAGREPPPARVPVVVSASTLQFDLPGLFPPVASAGPVKRGPQR